jgi:hypothetical protein
MNRSEHDRILNTYVRPEALIATKVSSDSKVPHEGDDADLRHDVWIIRTDDPTKKRNPEHVLVFDQVVDVGGVRLNSADHLHDLIVMKIYVLERLRCQYFEPAGASWIWHSELAWEIWTAG